MKNTIVKLYIALITIAGFSVLAFAQNSNDFLITKNSVGKVRLGMTIGEAKRIWKDYKFERTSDGEFPALITVKKGNENLLTVKADEKGYLNENSPIQDIARIEFIEVWDKNFKTKEGVHPQMMVQRAENVYGKIKSINRSEIEMREYAEFSKQPDGIDFRISSKKDFAGVDYKRDDQGLESTKQYVPSAYIFNILISERKSNSKTVFSSFYTDLNRDCTSFGGDDGGHVLYHCTGPENYRIKYFDSATTLEFYAETTDGEKSVRLGAESLTYPNENSRIEWRLADGKPFAVIMRTFKYERKDGEVVYPTKKISEKLIIKGLEGFETIDFESSGKGANERARDLADNEYYNATASVKRIEIPKGKNEITLENILVKGDEKIKYLLKAEKGKRMTVTIETVDFAGEEGPVMYGVVTTPNGDSDGQPGGKIFDLVLDETGDYEILAAQNMAKSGATNVRFKVTISLK